MSASETPDDGARANVYPAPTVLPNIYQRINKVMSELDSVSKVKQVKHGDKFKYIGHDDVTEALQPLFVKHRIVQKVSMSSLERDPAQQMIRVLVLISWVNIDSPTDEHTVQAFGESCAVNGVREGTPRGDDLQIGKAVSYAVKVAQLKNFVLYGDSTPDNETEQPKAQARQQEPVAPKGEPVADVMIDALIGQYEAVKTRAELDIVRNEVFAVQPRMTQAQEDKLAPFDRMADERTLK